MDLKEEFNRSIKNLTNNEEILNEIVYQDIAKYKLYDYITTVDINHRKNQSSDGKYIYSTKSLIINLDSILSSIKADKSFEIMIKQRPHSLVLGVYYNYLNAIFHELQHAKQYKSVDEDTSNKTRNKILYEGLTMRIPNSIYRYVHDILPHEHEAYVIGHIDAVAILKAFGYKYEYSNDLLVNELLNGYTNNSPMEKLYDLNLIDNIDYEMDTYNSLLLGLPVNYEVYDKLHQTDENVTNIKRYIKQI